VASIDRLGRVCPALRRDAIDLSVVRDLTEQDLKDLGVLLGHRRKMLRAIAELDGECRNSNLVSSARRVTTSNRTNVTSRC